MAKDFTQEFTSSTLPARPLNFFIQGGDVPHTPKTTSTQATRFEALFALYRNYQEYDYEDWHVAKPARSETVSEEVGAAFLYYAHKSLERQKNSIALTVWERVTHLATKLAKMLLDWAPLSATLSSQITETAELNNKSIAVLCPSSNDLEQAA